MRNSLMCLVACAAVVAMGCDDSHDSGQVCKLDCGHGTCFMSNTLEKCSCEKGYKLDTHGTCGLCTKGYNRKDTECVPESVCTGQCTGEHQMCTVVGGKPQCECAYGFESSGGSCKPMAACSTKFHYRNPDAKGKAVYVTGDFEASEKWSCAKTCNEAYKMRETSDGVFELSVYLEPGNYEYRVFVNEPSWGNGQWTGEGNSVMGVLSCAEMNPPHLKLSATPSVSGGNVTFTATLEDALGQAENPQISVTRNGAPLAVNSNGKSVTVTDIFGADRKVSYVVSATSSNGAVIDPLYFPVWNEDKPFEWRDAILYFTFTDRFYNGDKSNDRPLGVDIDWAGGDFAGLKQKVEEGYFDKLGVNALWISSVSMNTQSIQHGDGRSMCAYHSYWPIATGYTEQTKSIFEGGSSNGVPFTPIEPHFGTLDELRALVKACHDRGIRVLVDFAVNHVDEDSPLWKNNPEWFNFYDKPGWDEIVCNHSGEQGSNWDLIPETCWFAPNLPDFNFNLPEVRKLVVDHAKWLIRTTDIDGFRLDAVKHMPVQFIKDLRAGIDGMLEGSGQTFYIVGETFDGAGTIKKYIGDDLLHGQFDFPLYNTLRDTIMKGWRDGGQEGKFYDLMNFAKGGDGDGTYGNAIMSTFLGNHDVARAISHIHFDNEGKYGNNPKIWDEWAYYRLKVAWTYLLTSPGIPLIYYGDEYGLEGANDPDNRRMMQFDIQNSTDQCNNPIGCLNPYQSNTLDYVRLIAKIRRAHPALSRGKRTFVGAKDRSMMYLMEGEGETILVGISDTLDEQTYNVGETLWNALGKDSTKG